MQKILFITTIPATMYFFMDKQIPFLQANGYQVSLVSSNDTWITTEQVKQKYGIDVFTVPFIRRFNPFLDFIAIVKLVRIILKVRPDVVHYSTPKAALCASIASFLTGVPFRIYLLRGIVFYQKTGVMLFVLKLIERIVCVFSHTVIVNSLSNINIFVSKNICNNEKIGILGYGSGQGVDAICKYNPDLVKKENLDNLKKEYNIANKTIVYSYVGRIEKDKGIDELLMAWEILMSNKMDAKLLIVGPALQSWNKYNLHENPNYIKNQKSISITGVKENLLDYYGITDILILPSYREGFPNVVLEAGAMEIAVITTDAPGCIDSVKNGLTGFTVPVKNATALAAKMSELALSDTLRSQIGKAARKNVIDNYNPLLICEDLLYLLKNNKFKSRQNEAHLVAI